MLNSTLTLRSPHTLYLWIGATVASAIPMSFGAYLLWPFLNCAKWTTKIGRAFEPCVSRVSYSNAPFLFEFPIGFTFLLMTPFVTFFCCRYVIREDKDGALHFNGLLNYTLGASVAAHGVAALIHIFPIIVVSLSDAVSIGVMLLLLAFAAVVQALIGVFITIPLSVFCASVFRAVALTRINKPLHRAGTSPLAKRARGDYRD